MADKIREQGAAKVYAACVHGVLSGAAHDLNAKSSLEEMILTDSIPVHALAGGKLMVLSIAPLLGEAIARNHQGKSISALFV